MAKYPLVYLFISENINILKFFQQLDLTIKTKIL